MSDATNPKRETPLEGWKEIGAYLQRTERTVRRWEKTEALPVYRQVHGTRTSVYAYPSELDSWRERRLPNTTGSPTRKWIPLRPLSAFASTIALALMLLMAGSGPQVGTMNAQAAEDAGLTTRKVWEGAGVDLLGEVSPDGKYLSFVDWETGDLAIRDLATGEDRRLPTGASWEEPRDGFSMSSTWSPDSTQLLYAWQVGDNTSDLRIIGIDGSPPRTLYQHERDREWAEIGAWSPDGREVLAMIQSQIVLISVEDGSQRVVKELGEYWPWNLEFSPDGRHIAYDHPPDDESQARDVFLLSVDDGTETPLVEHAADDFLLGWSPDGRVLFASDRTGVLGFWAVPVSEGKSAGAPQLIKPGAARVVPLGFTRGGSFYYGYHGSSSDIYTAKFDPLTASFLGSPAKLSMSTEGYNFGPSYSPDGRHLAYATRRDNNVYPLWVANVLAIHSFEDGKDEVYPEFVRMNLTDISGPRWSPDGRSILVSGNDSQRYGMYLLNTETPEVNRVLQCERGVRILGHEWSRDGRSFYYWRGERNAQGRPQQILVHDLETGQEKLLYDVPWSEGLASFAISPDGRWVSYLNRADNRVLGLIPTSGGDPRELYKFSQPGNYAISHVWTPGGEHILFSRRDAPSNEWDVWRLPVEGGEPEKLNVGIRLSPTSFRPDGQEIAFDQRSSGASAVWVIENFLPETGSEE